METLYNIVTYNHRVYAALTKEKDRTMVEQLIGKLQFLETEIFPVSGGSINSSPTGNVFLRNYPPALQRKMDLV